jgi:hypothetical protein
MTKGTNEEIINTDITLKHGEGGIFTHVPYSPNFGHFPEIPSRKEGISGKSRNRLSLKDTA